MLAQSALQPGSSSTEREAPTCTRANTDQLTKSTRSPSVGMGGPWAGVSASFGIAFLMLLERTCCCYRVKSFDDDDENCGNDRKKRGMAIQARRERRARMSPRDQLVTRSRL
uniref:Uncharacterized protein n=1 Tax=Plectus sambesii TaxID=2011161 RepID=A0A914V3G4_9BILA